MSRQWIAVVVVLGCAMTCSRVLAQFSAEGGVPWEPRSAWDGRGPAPAYATQSWPEARLLVWAHPGESGNLDHATNWVERNAQLTGRHRGDAEVWGNLWVRDGGWILHVAPVGDRHSFFLD